MLQKPKYNYNHYTLINGMNFEETALYFIKAF